MTATQFPIRLALGLAFTLLGAAGCQNPVEDEHEEHPIGLAISNAQGQSVATLSGSSATGQLTVPLGSTALFTVVVLGEDGDVLPVDGEELALSVASSPAQATVAVQGLNRLAVTGVTAGTGPVRIELLHDGHAEFGGNVPVVVTAIVAQ